MCQARGRWQMPQFSLFSVYIRSRLAFPQLPPRPQWLVVLCYLASSRLCIFQSSTDSNINWYNEYEQRKRKFLKIIYYLSSSTWVFWLRQKILLQGVNQKFTFISNFSKEIEMHIQDVEFECCFDFFALKFSSFAGYLINFD